jgi:hypothetical protein
VIPWIKRLDYIIQIFYLKVQKMKHKITLLFSITTLFALLISACGASGVETTTGAQTFIARLNGAPDSARVVVVVEDGKFDAYICSLDDPFNLTTARWYKGDIDVNGGFQGVSTDGVTLTGSLDGDNFSGTVTNIEGQTFTFGGIAVSSGGPAGLYRGVGTCNGEEVIVGTAVTEDGTFAATAQIRGRLEFVSPVANEPNRLSDTSLAVKIGPDGQEVTVDLVTTLKGPQIF